MFSKIFLYGAETALVLADVLLFLFAAVILIGMLNAGDGKRKFLSMFIFFAWGSICSLGAAPLLQFAKQALFHPILKGQVIEVAVVPIGIPVPVKHARPLVISGQAVRFLFQTQDGRKRTGQSEASIYPFLKVGSSCLVAYADDPSASPMMVSFFYTLAAPFGWLAASLLGWAGFFFSLRSCVRSYRTP